MDPRLQPVFLPLSALIEELKENGFLVGVDNWEDLYRLLSRKVINVQNADPEELRSLLCPLFAVNEEQQQIFYRLFDQHFASYYGLQAAAEKHAPPPPRPSPFERDINLSLRYIMQGAAALVLSALLVWIWFEFRPLQREIVFEPQPNYFPSPIAPQDEEAAATPVPPAFPGKQPEAFRPMAYLPLFDPDPAYFEMKDFWSHRFRQFLVQAGLWVVLGGCSIWIIFLLYQRKRKFLLREKQKQRDPLSFWPVRTEERIRVQLPFSFFQAANSLRRRLAWSSPQLDVNATVRATIAAGGRPSPCFVQRSRPAEYLVLLPDDNPHSLFTAYLDHVFLLLGKTDIVLHRYFYKGEPKHFYAQEGEKALSLQALLYHHGNCRLLLVAHPELLDAAEQLTENFRHWSDRAVLLSALPENSSAKNKIEEEFHLLPAGIGSLDLLVQRWEEGAADEATDAPRPPEPYISDYFELRPQLLEYFRACRTGTHEDELLRWLAACCLYPELHWDLLLFAGKILQRKTPGLLRLENLEALARLPWLRQGTIPAAIRDQLINDETLLPADLRDELIIAVSELVQDNMPGNGNSVAYERRMLHLAFLEALLSESERSRRERIRELKRAQERSGENDESVNIFLNRHSMNPFAGMLGGRMKDALYTDGQPHRGLKPVWSTTIVGAIAVVLLFLINVEPEYGNVITHDSKVYYIDNAEKQASWQSHRAAFFYNPHYPGASPAAEPRSTEHAKAAALIDSAHSIAPAHPVAALNRFVREVNYDFQQINEQQPAMARPGLRNKERELENLRALLEQDSLAARPYIDSALQHLRRVETQYWFARWLCASAVNETAEAAAAQANIDTALLDEERLGILERMKRR